MQKHAQAAGPLNSWVEKVKGATWHNHAELKKMFPSADYVKNGRYVFNLKSATIIQYTIKGRFMSR